MAYLCTGDISTGQLLEVIHAHCRKEDRFLMAFSPDKAKLEKITYRTFSDRWLDIGFSFGNCWGWRSRRKSEQCDDAFLSATEQGRIFSPDGELRWRKLGETLRTVYLGYPPISNVLTDCSDELENLSPTKRKLLLWGKRTGHYSKWLEQQMPHNFDYPIDSSEFPRGRVALVVEQWVDAAGIPKFSRYHSIDEVQGEQ
jgi:hypothetical protein